MDTDGKELWRGKRKGFDKGGNGLYNGQCGLAHERAAEEKIENFNHKFVSVRHPQTWQYAVST